MQFYKEIKEMERKSHDGSNKRHQVVETIEMADGSLKDFIWYSDDWNGIQWYFEDRGIHTQRRIAIDGQEVSLEEADKMVLEWEKALDPSCHRMN